MAMSEAWVAVIQVFLVCLLFIPGVKGVYSWYLLISQIPPWMTFLARANTHEFHMAIYTAWWICFATLILAFISWSKCETLMDCTSAAAGAGATLAVSIGLVMTNAHMYNMERDRRKPTDDASAVDAPSGGPSSPKDSLQKKHQ